VISVLLASCILASVAVADDHYVESDKNFDFSKLKTFQLRPGMIDSGRQELNNSLVLGKISDAVRSELSARGLKEEAADNADILVDVRFDGMESSSAGKPGSRPAEGHPGTVYVQGTLNIELFAREKKLLVWEGTYRDREDNASRLARRYPADAKALLPQYPPKEK
jgi:hypothetical protein